MKKICELIAITIFKVDTVLYKTLGFVSSFRRRYWAYCGEELQQDLDCEHARRDQVNSLFEHNYTTKQALEVYFQNEVNLLDW